MLLLDLRDWKTKFESQTSPLSLSLSQRDDASCTSTSLTSCRSAPSSSSPASDSRPRIVDFIQSSNEKWSAPPGASRSGQDELQEAIARSLLETRGRSSAHSEHDMRIVTDDYSAGLANYEDSDLDIDSAFPVLPEY